MKGLAMPKYKGNQFTPTRTSFLKYSQISRLDGANRHC